MSKRETEIKLPVSDLEATREKLISIGAAIQIERHFEENFVFDTQDLRLRHSRILLRVRRIRPLDSSKPAEGLLTVKADPQISDGIKDREEIESRVANPDQLILIFQKLGFNVVFEYQKFRSIYSISNGALEICLDETPVGNFLELDGDIGEIHEYASKLGFAREHYIAESYASLYFRRCRKRGVKPGNMIFE